MNINEILRQFPDNVDLRAHASTIKRQAMERWFESRDQQLNRELEAFCLRAEILALAADLRDASSTCRFPKTTDATALDKAVAKLMKTSRFQLIVEMEALQAILDLLDAILELKVTDGVSNATANSWLSAADKLLQRSRLTIRFIVATSQPPFFPLPQECTSGPPTKT